MTKRRDPFEHKMTNYPQLETCSTVSSRNATACTTHRHSFASMRHWLVLLNWRFGHCMIVEQIMHTTFKSIWENKERLRNSSRVVKDVTDGLFGSGRNITTDNFFTSLSLAQFLLSKQLTLLDTLWKNRREVSHELVPRKRVQYESVSAFTSDTAMVSYAPKKNKSDKLKSPVIVKNMGLMLDALDQTCHRHCKEQMSHCQVPQG